MNISKISRLPEDVREKLNMHIANGESSTEILPWLNKQPAVKKILASQFNAIPIGKQNLADWKSGGYADWQARQEAGKLLCDFTGDAAKLIVSGKKEEPNVAITEGIARWFAMRYYVVAKTLLASVAESGPAAQEAAMSRIGRQIALMRRGDQSAARLRLDERRLKLEEQKMRQKAEAGREAKEKSKPRRRENNAKIIDALGREMFHNWDKPDPLPLETHTEEELRAKQQVAEKMRNDVEREEKEEREVSRENAQKAQKGGYYGEPLTGRGGVEEESETGSRKLENSYPALPTDLNSNSNSGFSVQPSPCLVKVEDEITKAEATIQRLKRWKHKDLNKRDRQAWNKAQAVVADKMVANGALFDWKIEGWVLPGGRLAGDPVPAVGSGSMEKSEAVKPGQAQSKPVKVEKGYWDLNDAGRLRWDEVMRNISVKMHDRGGYWNYNIHKWVLPGNIEVGPAEKMKYEG